MATTGKMDLSYMNKDLVKYWRPAMAWQYLIVCLFDFMIMPIILAYLNYTTGSTILEVWEPLTLRGGGLYHMAMGVVTGASAWGRSKEKIAYFERFGNSGSRRDDYDGGYGYSYRESSYFNDDFERPPEYRKQPTPKPEPIDDEGV